MSSPSAVHRKLMNIARVTTMLFVFDIDTQFLLLECFGPPDQKTAFAEVTTIAAKASFH
jgi:hypothetical protein